MIRAVVVDDDKDTVALFSEILLGNNINVVGKGYNGQEAAFLYQKLKPDVIFLDVIMPVYDCVLAYLIFHVLVLFLNQPVKYPQLDQTNQRLVLSLYLFHLRTPLLAPV